MNMELTASQYFAESLCIQFMGSPATREGTTTAGRKVSA